MVPTKVIISLVVGILNVLIIYGNAVFFLSLNLTTEIHRHIIAVLSLVVITSLPVYLFLRWRLLTPLLVPAYLTAGSLRDNISNAPEDFTGFVFAPFMWGGAFLVILVLVVTEFGLRSVFSSYQ
ncbi:hypothetical protein [Natrialba sp. SSL1]|uniref:hypothetical protein n=1 Tax=Natrialba sp. SSL1 TaxID=1869245 RepID=UPI0014959347|nr:hypothetical protein [Natrialba sp. SSL1]